MVKNGTFASPAMARAIRRLAGAGRTDQQHTARNAPAEPLEFSGIAQELDDLLEVLLGFVDARHVLERDATVGFRQQLGAALPETERFTAGSLHCRDRNIHTPMSAMNGSHETRSDTNHGTSFCCGRGGDRDAFAVEPLDQALGSFGA